MLSMVLESTNFTNTGIEENHVDRFENIIARVDALKSDINDNQDKMNEMMNLLM